MGTERSTRKISSTHHSDIYEASESRKRKSSSSTLMAKLAARQAEIEKKNAETAAFHAAATSAMTQTPGANQVDTGNPDVSHGTTVLRRQRDETLTKYPMHEKAALQVLREQGLPAQSADIVGADEMLLTEDHMIVRFDVHPFNPYDSSRHRYLVDVDMSYGQMTDHTISHLGPAQ